MSSGKRRFAVRPGDGLVVEGAGLQASVQDADKPVGQPPECVVVFDSPGAEQPQYLLEQGICRILRTCLVSRPRSR
jgi:hypothetical protein